MATAASSRSCHVSRSRSKMSQNRCSFKYRSTMGGQRRHSPSWAHRQGRRSAFRAAPRRGCACRGCRRRGDASRPTVSAMPLALRSSSTCMRGAANHASCGKAAVGIGVHHHFLGLVHSQPPPSSPRARAVLRCSRAPVAAEAAMATMLCWRRLSVSASAARRGGAQGG